MVKILKYLFLFIALTGVHGCVNIPLRHLTYFENFEYQGKPTINGSYYYLTPRFNYATGDTLDGYYIRFMVFYNNGLLKSAMMGTNDSLFVDDQVYNALIKYKDDRHLWGTYKYTNDTLFTQQIRAVGMLNYDVFQTKSLLINDSIIWRFEEKYKGPLGTLIVDNKYKFIKFNQLPDSTGYLYEKLQKRMRRNKN